MFKGRSPEKKYYCSFGFCPNEGGGPCPIFLSHVQEVHFLSLKESISSKMPIIWTLYCFCNLDKIQKKSRILSGERPLEQKHATNQKSKTKRIKGMRSLST